MECKILLLQLTKSKIYYHWFCQPYSLFFFICNAPVVIWTVYQTSSFIVQTVDEQSAVETTTRRINT